MSMRELEVECDNWELLNTSSPGGGGSGLTVVFGALVRFALGSGTASFD